MTLRNLDPGVIYRLAADDTDSRMIVWWARPMHDPAADSIEIQHTELVTLVELVRSGNLAGAVARLEILAETES